CFSDCPKLKTIKFTETSKFKELDHAFDGLAALEELDLPNSVESIKTYTIYECSSLKTLWLSKGLKTVEVYCIDTCPIENLHFKGTVEEWNKIEKVHNWCYAVSASVVHCTDGDVPINAD
ncbi:MAG: leucine-rich repeat protein, partial [Bacilli bacterium]|nr:leucine-rich repeat protein [Bacilli bacterium]